MNVRETLRCASRQYSPRPCDLDYRLQRSSKCLLTLYSWQCVAWASVGGEYSNWAARALTATAEFRSRERQVRPKLLTQPNAIVFGCYILPRGDSACREHNYTSLLACPRAHPNHTLFELYVRALEDRTFRSRRTSRLLPADPTPAVYALLRPSIPSSKT